MGFFLVKEIKSKEGVLHFRRWRIIETPWFAVYIHGIYKADEDKHLHSHPWNYASFILSGSFSEETLDGINTLLPGSFVRKKANKFHKIKELHTKKVFTLFFTGRKDHPWGYHTENGFVDHETYRKLKHENKY